MSTQHHIALLIQGQRGAHKGYQTDHMMGTMKLQSLLEIQTLKKVQQFGCCGQQIFATKLSVCQTGSNIRLLPARRTSATTTSPPNPAMWHCGCGSSLTGPAPASHRPGPWHVRSAIGRSEVPDAYPLYLGYQMGAV